MKSQVKERIQSLLEIVSSETKEVAGNGVGVGGGCLSVGGYVHTHLRTYVHTMLYPLIYTYVRRYYY